MTAPPPCCDDRRADEVRGRAGVNGIDFLEVWDGPAVPAAERQRVLFVHFLNDPAGLPITRANVALEGGDRLRPPAVLAAAVAVDARSGSPRPVLVVELSRPGDFAPHVLRLVEDPASPGALAALDPVLSAVTFSFKAACESEFDAALAPPRPAPAEGDIGLDYRARDFRPLLALLQDRYALLTGDAETGHPADPATALLELLAHVGDQLAYRQDVAVTEGKLDTARLRVSARRHARLLDEAMRDGCAARLLVQFGVDAPARIPAGTRVLTGVTGLPRVFSPGQAHWPAAIAAGAAVFETMAELRADPALDRVSFHTWGGRACTLPRGATAATLRGDLSAVLRPGDWLVLGEVRSPRTGAAADADLSRRHAVRLVSVAPGADPIGGAFEDPPRAGPQPVTEVAWHAEDALPWPLVLSAEAEDGAAVPECAVAWGNLVPADHGRTLDAEEALGEAPEPRLRRLPADKAPRLLAPGEDPLCRPPRPVLLPARWRPALAEAPLTLAVPLEAGASARAFLGADPAAARPALLRLRGRREDGLDEDWHAVPDLLRSGDARHVVVEIDEDGRAALRFGRDGAGRPPPPRTAFRALYRVGCGPAGNIGADTLAHVVTNDATLLALAPGALRPRNPLPGAGGTAPEPVEALRRRAPFAFQALQRRAVTPADHARAAAALPGVQGAVARLRWTGSWHNLCLAADRLGGAAPDAAFRDALRARLDPLRLMGQELTIEPPLEVAMDFAATVTLHPAASRAEALRALRAALRPLLAPDALSFGQAVHLSPLVAALQAVDGVRHLRPTRFERRDAPGPQGLADGVLRFARRELPRLSDDPNRPEHGAVALTLAGGR